MSFPRVYGDFHNLDDSNRLRLTCAGTLEDLARQAIELSEGLALTFYMDDADDQGRSDDILVDGTTHYDPAGQCWVAIADWSSVRHASDEARCGVPPAQGAETNVVDLFGAPARGR